MGVVLVDVVIDVVVLIFVDSRTLPLVFCQNQVSDSLSYCKLAMILCGGVMSN